MKIVRILGGETPSRHNPKSDLMCVEVEYDDGTLGESYIRRIRYKRIIFGLELLRKCSNLITDDDLDNFRSLCVEEEQEERFWDESPDLD